MPPPIPSTVVPLMINPPGFASALGFKLPLASPSLVNEFSETSSALLPVASMTPLLIDQRQGDVAVHDIADKSGRAEMVLLDIGERGAHELELMMLLALSANVIVPPPSVASTRRRTGTWRRRSMPRSRAGIIDRAAQSQ